MSIATLGGGAAATSATSSVLQAANISQQDFLQILLTQLTYQDPMKPLDNQEFVAQLAQFTTLAQTQQLNSNMDNLLVLQAGSQSVGLLGRTVDINSVSGVQTGTVSALAFDSNGQPQLTVTASSGSVLTNVGLADIVSVR
jgi:flagellar basal-body rod modification protein FlgD